MTEADFEAFFEQSLRPLMRQALVLTGDLAAAADLAQEALTRAWQHWGTVGRVESPGGWTRRVLDNLAIDRWRLQRKANAGVRQTLRDEVDQGTLRAEHLDVVEGLRGLPEKQRRALVLYAVLGLSLVDIAHEMDASEATVRSWISRARRSLQRGLEETDNQDKYE